MFRYFDGDFRRRPEQNLAGSSKKLPREELLKKAAQERRQREEIRRRNTSAIMIQSVVRGFLSRQSQFLVFRKEFDERVVQFGKDKGKDSVVCDINEMSMLTQRFIMFYSVKKDQQRIIWLNQQLIKHHAIIVSNILIDHQWLFRLKSLLHFNIKHLQHISANNDLPIATSLRVLELFTIETVYKDIEPSIRSQIMLSLWHFLVSNGFFKQMRLIIDSKVPEPYESISKPATPLAQSLLEILLRPLRLEVFNNQLAICDFSRFFFKELLNGPLSNQVRLWVLPSIVNQIPVNLQASIILNSLLAKQDNINESSSQSHSSNQQAITLPANIWLLYSVITLMKPQTLQMNVVQLSKYLKILSSLTPTLFEIIQLKNEFESYANEDEDFDHIMEIEGTGQHNQHHAEKLLIFREILDALNEPNHVHPIIKLIDNEEIINDANTLVSLSCLCHVLLSSHPLSVNQFRLLYTLAFNPKFLRVLWKYITSISTPSVFGSPTSLLYILSRGLPLASVDWCLILPQLTLFASLFSYLLPTLDDVEFYQHPESVFIDGKLCSSMPFSLQELSSMSLTLRDVCVGLVELAYHDARPGLNDDYKSAMKSVNFAMEDQSHDHSSVDQSNEVTHWTKLFKCCVNLLRQLHARDSRRSFCGPDHWISKQVTVAVERPTSFRVGIQQRSMYREFIGLRHLSREELEVNGPPLSTIEVRNVTILQEIPFVVAFHDRVKMLQTLMGRDKAQHRSERDAYSTVHISIRRNYIYEDAFEKLSPENEPNLKQQLRVQLANAIGLDEAGIDGGGIFREFLSELLKTAFDPNRGFFSTSQDRMLYPNPAVHLLFEDHLKHYYFIGRVLGKAIYDNMLVELPFAAFFLAKLLARHSSDIDIHHLASLDPVMYKNLVFLKNYEGDVSELGLDFTVMNSDLGTNQVVELKPSGANIPVTAQNRIEYIHLMADYKLNKQIRTQCTAFKKGLSDVLDLDWLRMFDCRELQILIAGAEIPIDIDDLRKHTKYSGGYSEEHPTVLLFWKVLRSLNEQKKKKLLKFVTSCSRPPLLGFKDLYPPFNIQNSGADSRLPTASTCMNLLKLPEYHEEELMKQKILYAIESGVGFELS